MKSLTKRIATAGAAAVFAVSLSAGIHMLTNDTATAAAATDGKNSGSYNYFYDGLSDLSKKFYSAFDELNASGDFADGKVQHNITEKGIVTSDQIKGWVVDGDLTVPKAFSAARDAFLTDHPEIFYIDFYKMTISAGVSGGVYSAYIDSGREANLFYDNGFTTATAVAEAIEKFDAKVDEIVAKVNKAQAEDKYSAKDYFLAKEVNKHFAENIKYDYVTYENKDDENYIAAANVRTSYGGIVEGKAVCGGFSTAYKVIMDKLGIPCITVNGYSNQMNEYGEYQPSSVYHMWNYVYLENPADTSAKSRAARSGDNGEWYSVDVTWDSSSFNRYKYAVLSGPSDEKIHVTDGVISSSKYELKYPELSSHNYGASGKTDGLQTSVVYESTGEGDDDGGTLQSTYVTVSYNGKSADRLFKEDGLYLCYNYASYVGSKLTWFGWMALSPLMEYLNVVAYTDGYLEDNGTETRFYENTSVYYVQFAVFDAVPDVPTMPISSDKYPEYNGKVFYYQYSDNKLNESKSVEMGDIEVNKTYGTYTPPPYIIKSTPNHQVEQVITDGMRDPNSKKVIMAENKAFIMEVTYDEPLHKLDESKPITISFISEHPNAQEYAKFYPLDDKGTMVELVERPKNSGSDELVLNTVRFKFAPSLMWEHNREAYNIFIDNLGSAKIITKIVDGKPVQQTSDKPLMPINYRFGRMYKACPACFNYDGRLWVECCAQPMLADNSDLSASNFEEVDENGKVISTFSENERSQMMLVAEKASTETVNTMLDEIDNHEKISIGKDDIKKSETYDIALQICGKYPKIPNGSYVKIMLGFPEGYGPEDEGVTFKLFHRKYYADKNTYEIEEVPCVVTQFGIVATVTSFSPYMVAAVDANKVTDKTIFASIDGNGGKLSAKDGKIQSLKSGESYTYTIVPDDGYQIYSVTLNGKDVTDKIADGKLTLTYDGLESNNELEIKYIANEVAESFKENNIVTPVKVIVPAEKPVDPTPDPDDGKPDDGSTSDIGGNKPAGSENDDNTTAIIITVSVIAVLVLITTIILVVIIKRRNNDYIR